MSVTIPIGNAFFLSIGGDIDVLVVEGRRHGGESYKEQERLARGAMCYKGAGRQGETHTLKLLFPARLCQAVELGGCGSSMMVGLE